jgi:hypothetical protein
VNTFQSRRQAMNDCIYRKKLIAYLDNQLKGMEKKELEDHLARCADCRLELDFLKQILELTELDPLPQFAPVQWKARSRSESRWWRWSWIPVAAAAAFLVIVATSDINTGATEGSGQEWMIVSGDSLSADDGQELADLLLLGDEDMVDHLETYEEAMPADIYVEIDDLSDEEEDALIDLLQEINQGFGRS